LVPSQRGLPCRRSGFVRSTAGGTPLSRRTASASSSSSSRLPTPAHRQQAEDQLVKELAARGYSQEKAAEEPSLQSWLTVGHVLRGFLRHSKQEHAKETADWHGYLLEPFLKTWGRLRVSGLRKKHVQAWVKAKGYNPTSAAKAIGVLKRAFNWAVEEEHIPRNPIAHVRKPKPLSRDRTLTPAERQLILAAIRCPAFRRFVSALTLSGARPGEVARVTAADCDLGASTWTLQRHKTAKKTGKPRVIYLPPEAVELTRELVARHPGGPIFRNSRGNPWTRNAIRIWFRNLRTKHPELKGIVAYTYRASFATDALENGVPDATVSALVGHTTTATLHCFYNKLSGRTDHLKDAAARATRPAAGDAPGDTPP
jgi:integrase/recombinase XerC